MTATATKKKTTSSKPRATGATKEAQAGGRVYKAKKTAPTTSGQVPADDMRLTANIRADLHLKLKHASVDRHTTMGQIIEEWIEKYL